MSAPAVAPNAPAPILEGGEAVRERANPFPGPRPYERDDASNFTGRAREIRELRALIGGHGVVVVVGPSGCGKSSLLRAGVRPELEKGEYEVLPIARLGEAARGRLSRADAHGDSATVFECNIASYLSDDTEATTTTTTTTATASATAPRAATDNRESPRLVDILKQRPRLVASDGTSMPRVLVIDQFEELFTTHLAAWRERPALLRTLLSANEGAIDTRMVLVLRAEYLSAFAALLARLGDETSARARSVTYYHVERLTQGGARAVMTTIFTRDFPTFADAGAEALARQMSREFVRLPDGTRTEAEGEFVEPLYLQLVCRSLWEKLASGQAQPDDTSLLVSADIDGELRLFVQRELDAVARETGEKPARLREWIEKSLITRAGTRDSVIREADETAGLPNAAVDALAAHRILRAEERAAGYWYELSHDRLVQAVQGLSEAVRAERSARVERGVRIALGVVVLMVAAKSVWDTVRADGTSPDVPAQVAPAVARASAERAAELLDSSPEIASEWIREALSLGGDAAVDSIAQAVAERALVSQQVQSLTQSPAVASAAAADSIVAVGTDDGRVWVVNALASANSSPPAPDVEARENEERVRTNAMQRYNADVRGVVPGWAGGVVGLAYARGVGKLAVAGREGRVSLITRPEWKRERDLTVDATLSSLAITPSADEMAVGTTDGTIVRLPAAGGSRRVRVPSGVRLAALMYRGRGDLLAVDEHGGVFGWGVRGGTVERFWQPPIAADGRGAREARAAIAPDAGEMVIAVGATLHRLRLRATRADEEAPLTCEALNGDQVTALAYSRSGASVIIGTATGRMLVWSVRRERCDWSAPGPRAEVLGIAPLGESRPVVTIGANREVRIWFQPPTRREVQAMVAAWREPSKAQGQGAPRGGAR